MSEENNEQEYQPYAAGIPVDEPVAVVAEPEPVVVEEPAPVMVAEPEPQPEPEPEPEPAPKKSRQVVEDEPVPAATHVIGKGDVDEVYLKQCVYKNPYARKSLTIHHLQRRLGELGYADANADRDGWYGDLTMAAVKAFQEEKGIEPTGKVDADTFERIFAGDPNVKVVLPE